LRRRSRHAFIGIPPPGPEKNRLVVVVVVAASFGATVLGAGEELLPLRELLVADQALDLRALEAHGVLVREPLELGLLEVLHLLLQLPAEYQLQVVPLPDLLGLDLLLRQLLAQLLPLPLFLLQRRLVLLHLLFQPPVGVEGHLVRLLLQLLVHEGILLLEPLVCRSDLIGELQLLGLAALQQLLLRLQHLPVVLQRRRLLRQLRLHPLKVPLVLRSQLCLKLLEAPLLVRLLPELLPKGRELLAEGVGLRGLPLAGLPGLLHLVADADLILVQLRTLLHLRQELRPNVLELLFQLSPLRDPGGLVALEVALELLRPRRQLVALLLEEEALAVGVLELRGHPLRLQHRLVGVGVGLLGGVPVCDGLIRQPLDVVVRAIQGGVQRRPAPGF